MGDRGSKSDIKEMSGSEEEMGIAVDSVKTEEQGRENVDGRRRRMVDASSQVEAGDSIVGWEEVAVVEEREPKSIGAALGRKVRGLVRQVGMGRRGCYTQ
jgi:hypothetical protein